MSGLPVTWARCGGRGAERPGPASRETVCSRSAWPSSSPTGWLGLGPPLAGGTGGNAHRTYEKPSVYQQSAFALNRAKFGMNE